MLQVCRRSHTDRASPSYWPRGWSDGGGLNHRVVGPNGLTDDMWDEALCDLPAMKSFNKTLLCCGRLPDMEM